MVAGCLSVRYKKRKRCLSYELHLMTVESSLHTVIERSRPVVKWRSLGFLALAELLAMGLWFSASAVVPQLAGQWGLTGSQGAWLQR